MISCPAGLNGILVMDNVWWNLVDQCVLGFCVWTVLVFQMGFIPFWTAAEARNVSAMKELLKFNPDEQLSYQNHVRRINFNLFFKSLVNHFCSR
jgi:hypothetical protein